jgi:multicomponent Na+:H+ antiporter subunit B
LRKIIQLIVVFLAGGLLIYGTFDMPAVGDLTAPAHLHVAPRYIALSYEETRTPNIVTSVLADYRGYDTLGEVVVIFTAAIGVLLLLTSRKRK